MSDEMITVTCETCNKVWYDRDWADNYGNWVYCPYCGGEVSKE